MVFGSSAVVGFAGSRSLPSVARPGGLVAGCVAAVVASGRGVAVGCCVGADAAVLRARLALPFPSVPSAPVLSVFAAFGPGGVGAWAGSAVAPVCLGAGALVVSGAVAVRWWAGGGAAVPLRARLAGRSRALVRFVAAGGAGSGLVVFFGSPSSRGSLLAARAAVAAGLPVLAFSVGFSASRLPSLGHGAWVAAGGCGVWARAWRWAAG